MIKTKDVELFLNSEMVEEFKELAPYDSCDKCSFGVNMTTDTICECSKNIILKLIADIPERYDVKIKLNKFLRKQLESFDKFMVITGDERYSKLLAFYIARKMIKENDAIVKYILTKSWKIPDKEEITDDIAAFNKADLVIFEDFFKDKSISEYKYYLTKRINKNKSTIIIGETNLINISDDWLEVEVDSNDIKVE